MSSIVIAGDTSGSVTLQAPAVAGSTVITLPSTSTTLVSSQWVTSGSNIYYNTSNVIGVGTSSLSAWTGINSAIDMGASVAIANTYGGGAAIAYNCWQNGSTSTWYYKNSALASIYEQNAGAHIWKIGASGTAGNAISFTQAMTLNASGNLGVGTTNPQQRLHIQDTTQIRGLVSSGNNAIQFWKDSTPTFAASIGCGVVSSGLVSALVFETYLDGGAWTERMRIDSSGNLLVGTTSTISAFNNKYRQVINPVVNSSAQYGLMINANANAYTQYAVVFADTYSEQIVGSIRFTTSATSYVTSSDYRLKNTIAPMTGALAKVALLKPVTYKWNVDGSDSQGFIAHELQEVVPECVTGEKDAVETYTDEDGNEQTRPVYQGIDTSFLVATLTAAIQEQQALITSLTERISVLENK